MFSGRRTGAAPTPWEREALLHLDEQAPGKPPAIHPSQEPALDGNPHRRSPCLRAYFGRALCSGLQQRCRGTARPLACVSARRATARGGCRIDAQNDRPHAAAATRGRGNLVHRDFLPATVWRCHAVPQGLPGEHRADRRRGGVLGPLQLPASFCPLDEHVACAVPQASTSVVGKDRRRNLTFLVRGAQVACGPRDAPSNEAQAGRVEWGRDRKSVQGAPAPDAFQRRPK